MQENATMKKAKGFIPSLLDFLFKPVDIASLIVFRIAFGAIMVWEVWRYFSHNWIEYYFVAPSFHFTYYGFSWLSPWPGNGMYYHFAALGLLAMCIVYGFYYRIATVLFFLGFSYVFLLEQSNYLNHFYLVSLISFVMIFLPAHRNYSFDSWKNPAIRSNTIPAWALWLLRIQVGVPYFFGGIAKINFDWLQGDPMRAWLANRSEFFLIGRYFTEEWAVYFFSYGGMLFDLLIVPFLLWRKTRIFAYICVLIFNLTNAVLFKIGIFPWFMIAATTIFFEPDWPRRFFKGKKVTDSTPYFQNTGMQAKYWTASLLGIYLLAQFSLPFRHFFYPGVVHWTEQGHRFSWHMKLREKRGKASFLALDPVKKQYVKINPAKYLTKRQWAVMITHPDMILQFAQHISRDLTKDPEHPVEVYAEVKASLNGREYEKLIDSTVNLAAQTRSLKPASWILPLENYKERKAKGTSSDPIAEAPKPK